jgi:hypothetical protein
VSVGLNTRKPLIQKVKTGRRKPTHARGVRLHVMYVVDFKDGERGRNRTFNLLIKSQLLCQLSYAPFNDLRMVGQGRCQFWCQFLFRLPPAGGPAGSTCPAAQSPGPPSPMRGAHSAAKWSPMNVQQFA